MRRFGLTSFFSFSAMRLSIIIDGSFNVSLEGPVYGVWFWCLFGVGIGATMIYRASLRAIEHKPDWQTAAQVVGST